ncbi:MAG: endonuclease III [bacterium]|nr:endonuclease III [bacterium]
MVKHFGVPERPAKLPNPVDTLIATILSQNTNDRNSYRAYQNLKSRYKSWKEVAEVSRKQIESTIKVAGLGKQKSSAIKKFLSSLKKRNDNFDMRYLQKMQDDEILNELTSINGIGVKTASCVLLFSLDRNVCPVDTHVHRTLNRIGLVDTKTPVKTFELISGKLPKGIAHQFHTNLIKLGRIICKSAKPLCSVCPILKQCKYEHKNIQPVTVRKGNGFLLLDSI